MASASSLRDRTICQHSNAVDKYGTSLMRLGNPRSDIPRCRLDYGPSPGYRRAQDDFVV